MLGCRLKGRVRRPKLELMLALLNVGAYALATSAAISALQI
jgi:hypothetical protein